MEAIWSACSQDDPCSAFIVWATAVSIFWETVFSRWITWHLAFLTLPALHSITSSTWRFAFFPAVINSSFSFHFQGFVFCPILVTVSSEYGDFSWELWIYSNFAVLYSNSRGGNIVGCEHLWFFCPLSEVNISFSLLESTRIEKGEILWIICWCWLLELA